VPNRFVSTIVKHPVVTITKEASYNNNEVNKQTKFLEVATGFRRKIQISKK